MYILNLGSMNVDEGWYVLHAKEPLSSPASPADRLIALRLLSGVNGGSSSNPNPVNKRRDLMLIAGLIVHPEIGPILFETGCSEDIQKVSISQDSP